MKQKPDVAIISNPTHLHLKIATECVKSISMFLLKKPISQNTKGYRKLKNLIIKNKRHIMVGYMMRHHPCVIKMKEWIDKKKLEGFCIINLNGENICQTGIPGKIINYLTLEKKKWVVGQF